VRARLFSVLVGFTLIACGKTNHLYDAGTTDANSVDALVLPPDARPPLPAYEVTGGAAKVSGAKYKADVQIGHGADQRPATGASHVVEGNAAVKP